MTPHKETLSNWLIIVSSDFWSETVNRCSSNLFKSTDRPRSCIYINKIIIMYNDFHEKNPGSLFCNKNVFLNVITCTCLCLRSVWNLLVGGKGIIPSAGKGRFSSMYRLSNSDRNFLSSSILNLIKKQWKEYNVE